MLRDVGVDVIVVDTNGDSKGVLDIIARLGRPAFAAIDVIGATSPRAPARRRSSGQGRTR